MAFNSAGRCSTCLSQCFVTAGHHPVQMSCGHHTCVRCHQRQWLTSERNDSEEITCIRCPSAVLNDRSRDRCDILVSRSSLSKLANVGSEIREVTAPATQTDNVDKVISYSTTEANCVPEVSSLYCQGGHHHRTRSCPATVPQTAPKTDQNDTLFSQELIHKVWLKRMQEWIGVGEPHDQKSFCGEVLRFTPLDQKKKHSGNSQEKHKKTKQILPPEKSSKQSDVPVKSNAETIDLKEYSDSTFSVQKHQSSHKKEFVATHTTHSQDIKIKQNSMNADVISNDACLSPGWSRHKHKRSHKKSKKKKKDKEKKKSYDSSSHVTDNSDNKTKLKAKEPKTSPPLIHPKISFTVSKEKSENHDRDVLPNTGDGEENGLSGFGKGGEDNLLNKDDLDNNNISITEKDEGDELFLAWNTKKDDLSVADISEKYGLVVINADSKFESKDMSQSRIDQVDNISTTENTKARMSVVGNSDGDIISITGDDDEETERAVMHRSSEMSLDSRASSTRFSSPMSLNDFQFNSLLENNDSPELEFQDWDSDKDNTQLEVANTDTKQESHSSTSMYDPALTEYRENITKSYQLSNDRPFIQEPDLIHCSDLAENLTPQMSQESVEQNKESLSLDGSVLDRSGILYYDPIDDSDEGRLVIVSRASSESTLIGEDETVTETVPRGDSSSSSCDSRTVMTTTVPKLQQSDSTHAVPTVEMRKLQPKDSATLVSKNDLSSITSRFATERASRLDTNANDLGKLLQSYQKYSETKHKKFADTGNGDGTNLQESSLVKGFQESYTTSLVCSQLANKALEVIKEAEYQKEPYQLSAMMLTGVLNILVQQANLASTICSELLNSTEVRQTELQDISGTTDAHKLLSVVATEPAVDCQSSFDAKTEIAKITADGNELGNSDPSDNDLRLNSSVAKCSTFASHSTKNNLTYLTTNCISKQSKPDDGLITKSSSECSTKIPSSPTETSMDHGAKSQTAGNKHSEKMLRSVDIDASTEPRSGSTSENGSQAPDNIPVPKSTEKSANHKSSIELKNHIFNRDTKQQADGEELQLSIEKSMVCRKEVKNVKTEDVEYKKESGHKNKSEQITDSSVQSFINTTTCDIACSDQERKMKKEKDAENDASMSITDIEDGTIDVTTDNLSISSKLTSPERKTPDLLETQASCGTQVTEDELETLRYESEKYKVQPTDNSIQKHSKNKLFREDKHSTQSNKTKDKKTRKSIHNQLQPPTGKRNLFESLLLETEEKVVESPSKYRKLQFGKLPQSHAKDRTHLVTPGGVSSKGLMGTVKTRSLSKQKCGDGTKNGRPEYEITQESKRTPKPDVSNKIASNTSVVLASSKPPTENKSKATPVLKSIKRSSFVPSSTHCSSDKEKNNSKSRYHSNCCLDNQGDSDNPCQESRNHHKNNALQRHFQRNSDGKVSQRVSVVLHDCKRVIGKHTEVNKTPSKRKLNMNKEDTLLQSGEDKPYRSNDGKQKTNSANLTDSKERLPAPKNKYTEESDLKDAIHKCQEADVPYSKHSSNCLHIGSLQENVKHDKTGQKTSDLDEHTESHSFCSDPMSSIVPEVVEANSCIITPQDKTCVLQDQARDEEIFKCLSFSDSDDDVPLARISESLRDGQCEGVSIVNSVDESEEDQLPKLAVPNARNNSTHRSRRSRCERPDLKTYLQICNSLPETTWRNSLMPPPLEAERRLKSCENTIPSTSAENLDLSAIGTTPESEVISGNQSSDGTHESDLEQVQLCDGEGQSGNGDNTDRGVFTSKKKRHRRRKSDKPVASSSSEECIPKGRKRGFQWKQECLRILDRVYNHHLSDPFRHEVKSKDIPDYYKIVKRGMCFDIIGYKLRGNIYEELRDFFLDVRLMFDNCRLYYKPESPIYQASLVVKCFFRKVSKEVLMPRTTARSRQPS